jgi:hypothetical protein
MQLARIVLLMSTAHLKLRIDVMVDRPIIDPQTQVNLDSLDIKATALG